MSKIIALGIVMVACNLPGLRVQAQDLKPRAVLFHVTSVQHADDNTACKMDKCSAIKYTVEGYVEAQQPGTTTQYVISCDEYVYVRPRPHRNNICARFHAGKTYTAELESESISFPHSMLNKDFETDYSIVAEREIPVNPLQPGITGNGEPREATNGTEQRDTTRGPEQLASKNNN
jgi:hypothetical protein